LATLEFEFMGLLEYKTFVSKREHDKYIGSLKELLKPKRGEKESSRKTSELSGLSTSDEGEERAE